MSKRTTLGHCRENNRDKDEDVDASFRNQLQLNAKFCPPMNGRRQQTTETKHEQPCSTTKTSHCCTTNNH
eukprot:m.163750 g.163750  ORF g.163750 m.163750 type:complete len:70 (+) comp31303_c0_seq1:1701-1910(+)